MTDVNDIPAAISLVDIHRNFPKVEALRGVTCEIAQGEIVALLGPNGAGKTTLIDVIVGLQEPTSGDSRILGMTPQDAIQRSLVGVVSQTGGLAADATVDSALKLFASFHQRTLPLPEIVQIARLEKLRKRFIGRLSGGERQRVRLALALLADPLVLILDEPTTGMDANARREFWEVMEELARRNRTIVFATHYLAEAETFASRSIIMKDGLVVADGATEQLRSRAVVRLTATVPAEIRGPLEVALEQAAGNWRASFHDTTVEVSGHDIDDAARLILSFPQAHSVRITESSLEEVFADLIKEGVQA